MIYVGDNLGRGEFLVPDIETKRPSLDSEKPIDGPTAPTQLWHSSPMRDHLSITSWSVTGPTCFLNDQAYILNFSIPRMFPAQISKSKALFVQAGCWKRSQTSPKTNALSLSITSNVKFSSFETILTCQMVENWSQCIEAEVLHKSFPQK